MSIDESDLKTIGCVLLGGIAGAALILNTMTRPKKARPKRTIPMG